jgi:hypothetical protein
MHLRNFALTAVTAALAASASVSSPPLSTTLSAYNRPKTLNQFAQLCVVDALGNDVTLYARGRSKLTRTPKGGITDPISTRPTLLETYTSPPI